MEAAKMASPKSAPKDAQVMAQILKDMGITEYEPRVINQMLEFAYRYVTTILEDAKIYSSHAKKSSVDADDVRLAIQCRTDQSFTSPPPRDFLLDIARQKNQTPLPLIKPYSGPRLPPDRYCLTAPNYRLKALQKKVSSTAGRITVPRLSVGAVSSRPSTPTLGTPSAQTVSVSAKVGAPVSLAGQRFTVQIPSSQPAGKSGMAGIALGLEHRDNHRVLWVGRGYKAPPVPLLPWAGTPSLSQVVPTWPGHFQGWGSHSFSGQPQVGSNLPSPSFQ
ncbi:transcription initiation factor TFIID subunit 9-like isoform X1 [Chiroxiphia lanceolata]|uniref:transcription initiation factor TFIID subunit 9-like isoform X1 n=1 Tax=Chiroxiphia lanceolata TaxID=296741 RepID=UPI0013CEB45F|nr:transcription initiation factor TFIID subunit 9-like isoform X1 [Chiroxiphia lanceolata]